VDYREMHAGDYAQCRALWEAAPGVRLVGADAEAAIAAFLKRNPGMSFVAHEGGAVVGTAMCGHDGRRGYIYHVAVKPEFRGRHIGTALVGMCLSALRAAGIDKCHVFVVADNELGNAFWASFWKKREDIALYSKDT
jgi:ribosomal protein S18 acetylase RimI-like enzyme